MFVNGWNFLVQVYYIPTFFQLAYGYSAVKAGALLLPVTLMQSALAMRSQIHTLSLFLIVEQLSAVRSLAS